MKYFFSFILTIALISCGGDDSPALDDHDEETPSTGVEFDTYDQKISYCIAVDYSRGCYNAYSPEQSQVYFTMNQVQQGMIDYLSGNDLLIQPWEKDSLMDIYVNEDGSVNTLVMSKEDAGYCAGMDEAFILISSLVSRKIDQDMDIDFMLIGIKEGFANMTYPTIPYMDAKREVDKHYARVNKDNGETFLAENKLIQGVVETESGLQYEVIKEGTGASPYLTDTVVFHYTGRFIDGRVFDSTVPQKIPYTKTVLNLIDGQQEGLMLMKEGGQTRMYIPSYLAYGDQAYGVVEANSTLVFDIELIKVIRYQQ